MGYIRGHDVEEDKRAAIVLITPKLRIRLTDPGKVPVPHGKCRVADEPGKVYECDGDGIVELPPRSGNKGPIELEWESREMAELADAERFPWSCAFDADLRTAEDAYCEKRLIHLGFDGESLSERVIGYQNHLGLPATGELGDIRTQLVAWHDGGTAQGAGGGQGAGDAKNAGTGTPPAAMAAKDQKATRKLLVAQHDDHAWEKTHAAVASHPKFEFVNIDDAGRDEILESMKAARAQDIFVFEGHTYAKLGGPVLGIVGDNWFGEDHITLAAITSALSASPPRVAVFAGCNSSEVIPAARAAGVKLVFGIENVIRDNVVHVICEQIADRITAHLIEGDTIREAMDKVNDWCEHAPKNDGNRITSESDDDVDLDLNLEDNGL